MEPRNISDLTGFDSALPVIYISVPLEPLRAAAEGTSFPWAEEVGQIVAGAQSLPWAPQFYSGLSFFDTWAGDFETDEASAQVFELNSNAAWSYADALIIFRVDGGSTGVGVELNWACLLGLPVLYLHPAGERVSRLVRGLCREADLQVSAIASPNEACEIVRTFLAARRPLIEDLARRRASLHRRLEPLRETLFAAWQQLGEEQRSEVCGVTRLTHFRVDRLVSDVGALAAAGLREVSSLAAALGTDFGTGPDLQPHQVKALSEASSVWGWSGSETLQMYDIGRLELRQPTQSRWAFGTADDWKQLHDEYLGQRRPT